MKTKLLILLVLVSCKYQTVEVCTNYNEVRVIPNCKTLPLLGTTCLTQRTCLKKKKICFEHNGTIFKKVPIEKCE